MLNGTERGTAAASALLLVALFTSACVRPAGGVAERQDDRPPAHGLMSGTLRVDTLERSYQIYVPRTLADSPAMLLVLHGGSGGSGARIRGFIGAELEAMAESAGFIVAYPDGWGGSWNDCRAGASYPARMHAVDDVAFLTRLTTELADRYGADPGRIFAIGWSNGAHLAFRLVLERPGTVHGIAAFGANLPAEGRFACPVRPAPVTVLLVNGTHDPINPYSGGAVTLPDGTDLGTVRSAEESLVWFGHRAGHAGEPSRVRAPAGVEARGWVRGSGPDVVLYTLPGSGHTIPSPAARFPEFLGCTERSFSGVEAAVRFFGLDAGPRHAAPATTAPVCHSPSPQ